MVALRLLLVVLEKRQQQTSSPLNSSNWLAWYQRRMGWPCLLVRRLRRQRWRLRFRMRWVVVVGGFVPLPLVVLVPVRIQTKSFSFRVLVASMLRSRRKERVSLFVWDRVHPINRVHCNVPTHPAKSSPAQHHPRFQTKDPTFHHAWGTDRCSHGRHGRWLVK